MNVKYKNSDYTNLFKHPAMGINLKTWLLLLSKNNFRVSIGFIPKALFLTFLVILNTPFHIYEHLKYSSRIKKIKIKSPVFILGHPRSGTTYLTNILSKDPYFSYSSTYDALVPNIFLTFTKRFKNIIAKSLSETRPQDNVKMNIDTPKEEEFAMANMSQTSYMHGFFFPKRIFQTNDESVILNSKENREHWKSHYDFFLKKIAFKYNNDHLLLKSPANTARIKEIYELYPDAKFIHISRNPYEVYRSTERLYEKVLPITSFQEADNEVMEAYIIDAYKKMYRKYLSDKELVPKEQFLEIRYEEFIQAPIASIKDAYQQFGLDRFEEVKPLLTQEVKDVSSYKKNTYQAIPTSIKKTINQEWAFAFKEFNYDLEQI